MSLDTILSIVGLAISIGSLVPLFSERSRTREIALAIGLSALVILGAVGAWRSIEHDREVRRTSNEILKLLAGHPRTLYQLEQDLHHQNFQIILEVIDKVVQEGAVQYEVVDLFDTSHTNYKVGIYSVLTLR